MYQALYRKYRPRTFDEVLGQKYIVEVLKNQIKNKNIGHAYLFSGTRGTGKTSMAKIFSRAVNCLDPVDSNPCNRCENCLGILDESIMDVIEMDAASNRGVNDIRDLREKVIYPPSKLKYKVYIIDEVHMLTTEAFNALLKTLEEPPAHLIFILATTEPIKIPETILSRCQRFDFKRMTQEDMVTNMERIVADLNRTVEREALKLIARNVDGAMRDALSLLDQCISYEDGHISYDQVVDILGLTNKESLFKVSDAVRERDILKALKEVDQLIYRGKDPVQFTKDLSYHYRNLMIVKTSKDPGELLEMEEEDLKPYLDQAGLMDLESILRNLDMLNKGILRLRTSSQQRIVLEMTLVGMIKEDRPSLEERIEALEQGLVRPLEKPRSPLGEKEIKARPAEVKKPEVEKTSNLVENREENIYNSGEEISLSVIKDNWDRILQLIRSKKLNVQALLLDGQVVDYENGLLTIAYEEGFGFHKEAINTPDNKEFIETTLSSYFNRDIRIRVGLRSELGLKNIRDDLDDLKEFFGEDKLKFE